MTSSVSPDFNKSFEEIIWQICFDCQNDQILLELRNESSLDLHYHIISLDSYRHQNVAKPEKVDWWSSVKGLYGNLIAILQYEDQNNPGPATLIIFDYVNGTINKEISSFLPDRIDGNVLTGRVYENHTEKGIKLDLNDYVDGEKNKDPAKVSFPFFIDAANPDFEVIRGYLEGIDTNPVLGADYLEHGPNIFLSYYVKSTKGFDRFILWIYRGNIRLHEKMDENMKGVSSESFITSPNRLIFVKNRRTLVLYEI